MSQEELENKEQLEQNQPEVEKSEENPEVAELNSDEEHVEEDVDYSQLDRAELLSALKELNAESNLFVAGGKLRGIKASYDAQYNEIKNSALQEFLNEGGNEEGFELKPDDIAREFDEMYFLVNDRVRTFFRDQEEQKKVNLHKKKALVDELRAIVDGNVEGNAFNEVKRIQADWKSIGAIPPGDNRELWASYKALLDRFYNNQNIYFELLELDRKKNYEAKVKLCEKAEDLVNLEVIGEALKTLHQFHDEYKHIGPVPKDLQEDLWQRFKKASDSVYEKRKEMSAQFEVTLEENKTKKEAVVEKVKSFEGFDTDSIKEWNKKTDELIAIQEEWKTIGPVPEKFAKDLSKEFWGYCKGFFNTKRSFFKKLDAQRDENLKLKEALCEKVEALKESTDFDAVADEIKKCQEEWRKIGQVPRKHNDAIYNRFRTACDHFFDRRREQRKGQDAEFEENLKAKEQICTSILALGVGELDAYQELVDQYNSIGFVPRKAIKKIAKSFEDASKEFIEKQEGLDSQDKTKLELTLELGALQGNPNARKILGRKRGKIKDKIAELKEEVQTLNTNIQFFANSKNIDELRKDVDSKIERIEADIKKLKEQLSILNEY